jgi:hypothetical protein
MMLGGLGSGSGRPRGAGAGPRTGADVGAGVGAGAGRVGRSGMEPSSALNKGVSGADGRMLSVRVASWARRSSAASEAFSVTHVATSGT